MISLFKVPATADIQDVDNSNLTDAPSASVYRSVVGVGIYAFRSASIFPKVGRRDVEPNKDSVMQTGQEFRARGGLHLQQCVQSMASLRTQAQARRPSV